MVSGNTSKIKLESAQYGKETRIAREERKMEGKNIYLSVYQAHSRQNSSVQDVTQFHRRLLQ